MDIRRRGQPSAVRGAAWPGLAAVSRLVELVPGVHHQPELVGVHLELCQRQRAVAVGVGEPQQPRRVPRGVLAVTRVDKHLRRGQRR